MVLLEQFERQFLSFEFLNLKKKRFQYKPFLDLSGVDGLITAKEGTHTNTHLAYIVHCLGFRVLRFFFPFIHIKIGKFLDFKI